jgi:2-keto-4-pentenoate hydratase
MKAFGITQPVRGTLLKKMLLKNGATLEKNSGIRLFAEGDLIVRVDSDTINQAKTKEDALKAIDVAIPFLELPDIPFGPKVKINGPILVAVNVGARYGVMGNPIPLTPSPECMERLKNFTIKLYDDKGSVFSEGKGTALLGDPLNVLLWISDSLAAEGKTLKKGDLLSLGSITKMMPTKPGTTIKATFTGLDPKGPVEISASFK